MLRIQLLIFSFVLIHILGCNQPAQKTTSPIEYNLENPEKMILPNILLEVSGIIFLNNHPDSLYAIQDEDGYVFKLAWGNKKHTQIRFAGEGDYEDMAISNGNIYILRSDGTLYSVPMNYNNEEENNQIRVWKKILPKGEYEGLYAADDLLYVLCKQCTVDKKETHTTGYVLSVPVNDENPVLQSTFQINEKEIFGQSEKKQKFQPSAIARHPNGKEWYILSSVNKLLVVTDNMWNVLATYPLPRNRFNQPEGIAFDRNKNLYISNEGDELTNGNVLKFTYKKIVNKYP